MESGLGLALGLFPVNILHNLVHVAFAIWGLAGSHGYFKSTSIIYAVFTVMG